MPSLDRVNLAGSSALQQALIVTPDNGTELRVLQNGELMTQQGRYLMANVVHQVLLSSNVPHSGGGIDKKMCHIFEQRVEFGLWKFLNLSEHEGNLSYNKTLGLKKPAGKVAASSTAPTTHQSPLASKSCRGPLPSTASRYQDSKETRQERWLNTVKVWLCSCLKVVVARVAKYSTTMICAHHICGDKQARFLAWKYLPTATLCNLN